MNGQRLDDGDRTGTPASHFVACAGSVEIRSESGDLGKRLGIPLARTLLERRGCYVVEIDAIGRVGEVLVSITGPQGHLPLLFRPEELETGYVLSVVTETLDRFGL